MAGATGVQNAAEIAAKMGAGVFATPLALACMEFGIDNDLELAHFLAQLSVESADFTRVVESMNYSVEGLLKTFGRHRISADDCMRYGRTKGRKANQVMIAAKVYGGEWGLEHLGNRFQMDGWNFRGHGLGQLTGRAIIEACSKGLFGDLRLIDDTHYLTTPDGASRSAAWCWVYKRVKPLALADKVIEVRRKWNGGLNGIEHAEISLNRAKKLLGLP